MISIRARGLEIRNMMKDDKNIEMETHYAHNVGRVLINFSRKKIIDIYL